MFTPKEDKMVSSSATSSNWNFIYKICAAAAIGAVVFAVLEILIIFFPGGGEVQETVLDWYALLQENPFLGLRNLGLINILINIMGVVVFFGLHAAHRENHFQPVISLVVLLAFIGLAIFFSTNRAFPMWDLSNKYTVADEAQRVALEAAGQALLAVGASHTPGTFLAFFFAETAGLLVSVVMLYSGIFSKFNAYAGMIGYGCFLIFEFFSSFGPGLNTAVMLLAIIGGLMNMIWNVLIARKLLQLSTASGKGV
jgi:hypothetical protein